MRINRKDIVKAKVLTKDGELVASSIMDEGFSSIAGVIASAKVKIPNGRKGPFVFEIENVTKGEYARYNNSGSKI